MCFVGGMRRGALFAAASVFLALGLAAAAPERGSAAPQTTSVAAANSRTFVDPTGDNPPTSPDVTAVQVSNDDAGRFEIRVGLGNRPELFDGDHVAVVLETDSNVN